VLALLEDTFRRLGIDDPTGNERRAVAYYLPLPNIGHPRTGLKPRTDGLLWERACRGGGHGGKQAAEYESEAAA
jgi:hypothetical protein